MIDVYAFAITAYEITGWTSAWEGQSPSSVIYYVKMGKRPLLEISSDDTDLAVADIKQEVVERFANRKFMVEIIKKCWSQSPDQRDPFKNIFKQIKSELELAISASPTSSEDQSTLLEQSISVISSLKQ